jgi:hemoglobin-like flavoprotein
MTDKQIILIKNSWKIFRGIAPGLIGEVFYSRLFIMMPSLKSMFNNPMDQQYKKLTDMLSFIVARLDKLEEVTGPAKELALRHVQYGVRPGHYKLVGDALIWTLEKGLGKDWNKELEEAWASCYSILSNTMIEAAYRNEKAA